MTAYADLEIGLHRLDTGSYAIELRYTQPESDADIRLVRDDPALVQLDIDHLRALALDTEEYGKLLGKSLFADTAAQTLFRQACSNAQALGVLLRLRLFIGPSAPELHSLYWETLRDPDGTSLVTSERILFSRYLSSQDWRRVQLRPEAELRALVVIANPANLGTYQPGGWPLPVIDVAAELASATFSLDHIPVTALASGGSATLHNLCDHLRNGYDILYLVCHGALIEGEPRLWLENEDGNAAVETGSELVTRLRELQHPPRLVVLASCQSGGRGRDASARNGGALAALGPRLAESGIPAVLAVQGNVTMQTMAQFTPVFFRELLRDGQIDRAMAAARGAVRERLDAWMPVLFMRLRSGCIRWYVPGFRTSPGFKKWPVLLPRIQEGNCTPILGPGLIEPLIGSSRVLAQRWAETYGFPLAPHNRDDLPQVAQYLAVTRDPRFPGEELRRSLRGQILERYGRILPEELHGASLDQLLETVWAQRQPTNPSEAHRVLAQFPFRIYITANPDNLLARALVEAGKRPEVVLCPWNEYAVHDARSVYDEEPEYQPTAERPLVYHLFGHLREPDSLVLTEDDYFNFLIGVSVNKALIPEEVRSALADTALLFLGFQLDDWNFRVLFRSIMTQEGGSRSRRYEHVGVQIDPEEGRFLEAEGAREYLESYFTGAHIGIYWGSTEDFVKELLARSQQGSLRPGSRVAQGIPG